MTTVRNETSQPLHALLANRWSPRGFDAEHELSEAELRALFEAARWAPSCYNNQPWFFVAGRRGSETFEHIGAGLIGFNQSWATSASALVLAFAATEIDGEPNPTGQYDLGQAVAHLTVQAGALGLVVHQMTGFDAEKYDVDAPAGYELVSAFAIGRHDSSDAVPEKLRELDAAPRTRKPLADVVRLDG